MGKWCTPWPSRSENQVLWRWRNEWAAPTAADSTWISKVTIEALNRNFELEVKLHVESRTVSSKSSVFKLQALIWTIEVKTRFQVGASTCTSACKLNRRSNFWRESSGLWMIHQDDVQAPRRVSVKAIIRLSTRSTEFHTNFPRECHSFNLWFQLSRTCSWVRESSLWLSQLWVSEAFFLCVSLGRVSCMANRITPYTYLFGPSLWALKERWAEFGTLE